MTGASSMPQRRARASAAPIVACRAGRDRRAVDAQRARPCAPAQRRRRRAAPLRPAAPSTTIVTTIVALARDLRRRVATRVAAVLGAQRLAPSPRVRFQTDSSKPGAGEVRRHPRAHDPEAEEPDALDRRCSVRIARHAVSAAARRLDPQPLPGRSVPRRLGRQLLAVEQVAARRARLAAVGAGRRVAAALGDQRVASSARAPRARARRRRRRGARPAPPEPRRSAYSTTRSGNSSSSASIGVLSVLLIATCTPLGPSASGAGALAAADRLVVGERPRCRA